MSFIEMTTNSNVLSEFDRAFLRQELATLMPEFGVDSHLFITGGTGFFGRWILESLAAAREFWPVGFRVSILTRSKSAFAAACPHLMTIPNFYFVEGDVKNFGFSDRGVTHVLHAATPASATLNRENPAEMLAVIDRGTDSILTLCETNPVRKLLFTSSGAVYGEQPTTLERTPETYLGAPDPCAPGSVYGEGKRVGELKLCLQADRLGYDAIMARCFAFVGAHLPLDGTFAAGNFILDVLNQRDIVIKGDGKTVRSYMYAADLVVWLMRLMLRGRSKRAYNVGSSDPISIKELAEAVVRATGSNSKITILSPPQPGPAPRYVPDTTRIETELGLKRSYELETALRSTAQWAGLKPE